MWQDVTPEDGDTPDPACNYCPSQQIIVCRCLLGDKMERKKEKKKEEEKKEQKKKKEETKW